MQGVWGGEKILRVPSEGCSHCFPYDPKRFTNILSGQSVFLKNHHLEPETTIYKWLFQLDDSKSWYRKWLFDHFHPFINGWPWGSSSFATNIAHLDVWRFDTGQSSKNRLPNGGLSLVVIYHGITLNKSKTEKIAQQKQAQHQFTDILPPTLLTTSPNPPKNPRIKCANHMEAIKEDVSATPCSFAQGDFFDVLFFVEVIFKRPYLFLCHSKISWLVVSTQLKNISQNRNLPQGLGWKFQKCLSCHHLVSVFVPKTREDSEKIHHRKTFYSLGKKLLGEILLSE